MTAMNGSSRRARWAAAALTLAAASAAQGASISVEGGAIVLGRTESSPVVIRVDEPPGTQDLPLRISVNVGSFSEPTRVGPGQFRAVYTPPPTRFPQVALVALWRETGPDARIDFLRIPLFGMTRVPVVAKSGALVTAKVSLDTFGPVLADRRGRAELPIVVQPSDTRCEVTSRERNGATVTKQVPVEVPPYNRLTAALVPHAVVADGRSHVRLDVLYDLGGAGVPPDRIRVKPSIGSVSFQRASRGRYTYRYTPPAATTATSVSFEISVANDPQALASAQLSLGLPPPARILVNAPAKPPRVGSSAPVPVNVLVLDAAGMGLPGIEVSGSANGQLLPAPAYLGGGQYEFSYRAPATYPPGGLVQFVATATSPAGQKVAGSINWQLEAAPVPHSATARLVPSPVPADGRTEARLILEVRDASGQPLEHAQLVAVASHGTLGRMEERGGGVYEHTYVPPAALPDGEATLRVVDSSGTFEQSFPIPLRRRSHRLLLGLGGGYTYGSGDASGPRASGEAWVPFCAGGACFGAGLAVGFGMASRTVTDPGGTVRSDTEATFVPVTVKVGYEAFAWKRLSVTLGGGGVATWARFESALAGGQQQGWGLGWMGFVDLGCALGPGQALLEISYGSSAVETDDYRINPGGVSALATYRVGIF
jgi:hypothetical protein